jgi:cyclopropane-fatty-acyl-phospholipid synthase
MEMSSQFAYSEATATARADRSPPAGTWGARLTGWLVESLARRLGAFPVALRLWNGARLAPRAGTPLATLTIRRPWTLLKLLLDPSLRFGEAYRAGELEVEGDLVGALEAMFRAWEPVKWAPREAAPRRPAVLRRAGRNARHHYDLGNAFFRLWLDERMVYTCAYFSSPQLSLEDAQLAKLDYVCRKLRLRPGDRVLEAGCGWGALALHMASRYGAHVTACNVSGEQLRFARQRAAEAGLKDRVRFVQDDFRNIPGVFDVFASVGMLEHVGRKQYAALGRVIHDRLHPRHGRGLLHFIGRNRPRPLDPWTLKRIFPGAYAPTLSEVFEDVLEPWDFSILDAENLRLHYARTLEHWRRRFEGAAPQVAKMYDEAFARTWRLYLAASEAAFATGWLQLFQVSFARAGDNDLAPTRAPLYLHATNAEL